MMRHPLEKVAEAPGAQAAPLLRPCANDALGGDGGTPNADWSVRTMGSRFERALDWHLIECRTCGAANGANAEFCWQCEGSLASAQQERGDPSFPVETPRTGIDPALRRADEDGDVSHERPGDSRATEGIPSPRRRAAWIAASCTVLVAAVAAGSWWASAQPPGSGRGAPAHASGDSSRTVDKPTAALDQAPAKEAGRRSSGDVRGALGLADVAADAPQVDPAPVASSPPGTANGCRAAVDALGLCGPSRPEAPNSR